MVLLVSLAVHALLLILFGGTVLFQEAGKKAVFRSEQVSAEQTPEVESPSLEEGAHQEAEVDPSPSVAPDSGQGSAAPEPMLKTADASGWNPPIRGAAKVPPGRLGDREGEQERGSRKLFGTKVGQKKLGAIVDVSGSMRPYLEGVMAEVLGNFPDAALVLVDGCGMEESDLSLPSPDTPSRFSRGKKRSKEKKRTNEPRLRPHLVELNRPEGLGSEAVSGWGGLRSAHPQLFEALRIRPQTWILVGEGAEVATQIALQHLAEERVGAIYWFSDFADPVEPREGEKAAEIVRGNKIEVYLHPMEGLKNIRRWSGEVGAKVIDAKVEDSRRPGAKR